MSTPIELEFDKGTLICKHLSQEQAAKLPEVQWDQRVSYHRAPAMSYRDIVMSLRQQGLVYRDLARAFTPTEFPILQPLTPRGYQTEAAQAWMRNGQRGVVCFPTGAGKTILAVMLISQTKRPTLVHVPTIDLMIQWKIVLERFFEVPVGCWGGGKNETHALTVTTYDSALIHLPHRGNLFGLAVFDECHHLPSDQYQYTAISTIAPFRLGLSATPEREDGKHQRLYQLVGGLCHEVGIQDLTGEALAPYVIHTIEVAMREDERLAYEEARTVYLEFLRDSYIDLRTPRGWNDFLKSSQSPRGRTAFKAYLQQKKLATASSAKLEAIWQLIRQHRSERLLIFTQDNEMAYRLGRTFLLPVITHHTKARERESFLEGFKSGEFSILVTSKVLNEGVDVPEANVAVVVSGSGSTREHVQRLGRVLRPRPGKQAVLYELVSQNTGEFFVNQRRRRHRAYQ